MDKTMDSLKTVIADLKKQGVCFADARDHAFRERVVAVEDRRVMAVNEEDERGVGIRVLWENGWGYASTRRRDPDALKQAAEQALSLAKAASPLAREKIDFAGEPAHQASFVVKIKEDPFRIDPGETVRDLVACHEIILGERDIIKAQSYLTFRRQERFYANTDGSAITTELHTAAAEMEATARVNGEVKSRAYTPAPLNQGYEHFRHAGYAKQAKRIAEEAREHCLAKPCESGKKDLILDPVHLTLTMHESVGHPTEFDRILGYEESLAGRSHVTPEKIGKFQYGSPLVNLIADNTLDQGLASYGYDDEGVACQKFPIVKDGILVGVGTNRELARKLGLQRASGTTRATRYYHVPIVRMPNLYLAPGTKPLTPEELIADTEEGIYIEGMGSFSIDQMRLNMQFGGDAFWEIKHGRRVGMLKNVTYQAISYEFWRSCDAICDERFFQRHGFLTCGKGDPCQAAQMNHGASPARFRQINVRRAK